ncbi:MAG: phosphate ABC transporter ATP-binding protein [Parvularculaceae bacterium]|nr:phosphate ABC transporter ATP-binding protein [Parvularculaceae bacterium]
MADGAAPTPLSPPASAATFECRGVSAFFGDREIIKRVDLDVAERKVTAFMGPSGCGKSTILRTLNRMHESVPGASVKGSVRFAGADLYAQGVDPAEVRARIGMVFQKPNPFPKSIFDNVAFAPRLLGLAKGRSDIEGRVEAALTQVGLWTEVKDRLKESALGLSGGQQQRLVIARAIAGEPSALLLDEPCSALDPAATARVEELIATLSSRLTIVVVTHSLAQARRIADAIAFFHTGEMIEAGPPEHLLETPSDKRVQDYLAGRTG